MRRSNIQAIQIGSLFLVIQLGPSNNFGFRTI